MTGVLIGIQLWRLPQVLVGLVYMILCDARCCCMYAVKVLVLTVVKVTKSRYKLQGAEGHFMRSSTCDLGTR